MSQPRSTLVEAFNRHYVEDMAATNEQEATSVPSAEAALEQIEAYLRVGWDGNASDRITEFEQEYGIPFEELTADIPGIEDPRRQ